MNYLKEYLENINSKKWGIIDFKNELKRLIKEYNSIRNTYLLVYTAAVGKNIPGITLEQNDFYFIRDILSDKNNNKKVDIYLETPGGSGEAAEEIVRWLRGNFEKVSFLTAGEAKSAGTIMMLSGDEILMTDTGSLGPIDAQMRMGRSVISAYDYMEWLENKRLEAERTKKLNPVDIAIISQISPGEIYGVENSLRFAQVLVKNWLIQYKFKDWNKTETRKIEVTQEMKEKRADEISKELTNHSKWMSHARSIKREDLEKIGLNITNIDKDDNLRDIVYRIHAVIRLIFEMSATFKVICTEENIIERNAMPMIPTPPFKGDNTLCIDVDCPKCGILHKLYVDSTKNPQIKINMKKQGFEEFPPNAKLKCNCGFEMDLLGIKNNIEKKLNKKII